MVTRLAAQIFSTSGTPQFLNVIANISGRREVNDNFDVVYVNAHAESFCRQHNGFVAAEKIFVVLALVVLVHLPVIDRNAKKFVVVLQTHFRLFDKLNFGEINQSFFAGEIGAPDCLNYVRVFGQPKFRTFAALERSFVDFNFDVVALDEPQISYRVKQVQTVNRVVVHVLDAVINRRRRERRDNKRMIFAFALSFAQLADVVAQIPIVGTKLLAPSRDNVRLVDYHRADGSVADNLFKVAACQKSFGRKIKYVAIARRNFFDNRIFDYRRNVRVNRCGLPIIFQLKIFYLVVHQPDKRRNYNRQQFIFFGKVNRGNLENDGFARAGRCRDENIAKIFAVHAKFDLPDDVRNNLLLRNGERTFYAGVQFLQVIDAKISERVVAPMSFQNFRVIVAVFKAETEFFGTHAENFRPC